MIVPYLPTDKVIKASNGNFIIRETVTGYDLWKVNPDVFVTSKPNINYLREDIGRVFKIGE
ncbi:hypothetical protein Bp8pC_084 [Bacillus phage Bp8p-C]|uniref:Uncharacterized protein n=2 Tax=Agatevirus Bp8pC TaxID=1910937 RepID=A0A0A0PLB5_9CAUD|nr:hypothetical protein AXJ20_gp084 [Bacillus phage Bp8p-C]YP_009784385.1 hypothetical protein QLX39_gp084 [Bacillus phage Bp8p-T]AHJ87515.1 hypothetical protein Bp8pC_084 [Bacillus phage Bp8p-C]AHJ87726.1 hypothetical protein Bp8pT_084 [Bacillus phage Bp8p-T]